MSGWQRAVLFQESTAYEHGISEDYSTISDGHGTISDGHGTISDGHSTISDGHSTILLAFYVTNFRKQVSSDRTVTTL